MRDAAGAACGQTVAMARSGLKFRGVGRSVAHAIFAAAGEERRMLLVNSYVAASNIEGVGVFTAEPITKGQKVWAFDAMFDRLIPTPEYEQSRPLVKDFLDKYAYPSPDKPGFIVYETDNGRFMNHTETPNLDFSDAGGAIALRDIAAGEELTCNYGDFYPAFEMMPGGDEMVAAINAGEK
jgi:uncharacterized protein